ncbi:MAG: hypothetical protein P9L93_04940 [Candidatus Gorgyraea atricola]|nr:hypothetical protein [Candidatus Gorgyraea atricola]
MVKRLGVFVFIVLVASMLSMLCYAEDPGIYVAEHYRYLTEIIEWNMGDPNKCVEKAKRFFESIDKEEYARNWEASMNKFLGEEPSEESMESEPDKSMMEYNNAIARFMQKYPDHGRKILELSIDIMGESKAN